MMAAIGPFLSLLLELWKALNKAPDPAAHIAEVHAAVAQLNVANTTEDKHAAASEIQKLFAK